MDDEHLAKGRSGSAEESCRTADIENNSKRNDSDVWRGDSDRNDCDAHSDTDSYQSVHGSDATVTQNSLTGPKSTILALSAPLADPSHRTFEQASAPCRSQHHDVLELTGKIAQHEERPSAERLDPQLCQLPPSNDILLRSILEQNKALLVQNEILLEQNKVLLGTNGSIVEFRKSMNNKIEKLQNQFANLPTETQETKQQQQLSRPDSISVITTSDTLSTNVSTVQPTLKATTSASVSEQEKNANNLGTIMPTVSHNHSSDGPELEHDPQPDFLPVIPLRPVVEVASGEENETSLFSTRAKLYRWSKNEWKERGVGNVKLLENTDGKIRLVMRRDRTLKICANHMLTADMKLTRMMENDKAWIWVANDFADEKIELENFCIKFIFAEEAKLFKEIFDRAKTSLSVSPGKSVVSVDVSSSPTMQSVKTKISMFFGNLPIVSKLSAESANKPDLDVVYETPQSSIAPSDEMNEEIVYSHGAELLKYDDIAKEWKSRGFGDVKLLRHNETKRLRMVMRHSQTLELCLNHVVTMVFELKPHDDRTWWWESLDDNWRAWLEKHACRFETPKIAGDFKMAVESALEPMKIWPSLSMSKPPSLQDAQVFSKEEVAPVITSLDKFDAKTDEDNEEIVYSHVAALLKYDDIAKEWKSRGLGDVKLLRHNETKRLRMVMRHSQTLKLCLNYVVTIFFKLKRIRNDRVWHWEGPDVIGGALLVKHACVFETPEIAGDFNMAVESAVETMKNTLVTTMSKTTSMQDVRVASEDKAASVIPLPDNVNAKTDEDNVKTDEENEEIFYSHNVILLKFARFGKIPQNRGFGDVKLLRHNRTKLIRIVMRHCQTLKLCLDQAVSKSFEIKPFDERTLLVGRYFYEECPLALSPSLVRYACRFATPDIAEDFKMAVKSALKTTRCTRLKTRFFVNDSRVLSEHKVAPVITSPDKFDAKTDEDNEEIVYSHGAELLKYDDIAKEWKSRGFGDVKLLRHNETKRLRMVMRHSETLELCLNHVVTMVFELKPHDDRTWWWESLDDNWRAWLEKHACRFETPKIAGDFKMAVESALEPMKIWPSLSMSKPPSLQDAQVFSKEEVAPVITSLDKFDAKTDEDNEEIVYSHVAALLKYDDIAKEWKSRGFGDVKLLRHNETKRLRMVMRHSETLELCLNHVVTMVFELKPHDDRTWWWESLNDNWRAWLEKHACRFETPEIAGDFKMAVESALKTMKNTSMTTMWKTPSLQDIKFVSDNKSTPEENATALEPQLPGNFNFNYVAKPDHEKLTLSTSGPIFPSSQCKAVSGLTTAKPSKNNLFTFGPFATDNSSICSPKNAGVGTMTFGTDTVAQRSIASQTPVFSGGSGTTKLLVNLANCRLFVSPDSELKTLNGSDRGWMWAGVNLAEGPSGVEELVVIFKNSDIVARFKEVTEKTRMDMRERRNSGQARSNELSAECYGDEQKNEVDEEDNDEEDEGDDVDEEDEIYSTMFASQAELMTHEGSDWTSLGTAILKILADWEIHGAQIIVKVDNTGEIISNTVITMETTMNRIENTCVWTAIDEVINLPIRRTLKAVFSTVQLAQDMYSHFQDGRKYAEQANISEAAYYGSIIER